MSGDSANPIGIDESNAERGIDAADGELTPDSLLTGEFLAKLANLSLFSRKILSGKLRGERRSVKRGQSLEFADFKHYTQGDDLRRIDWNAYGRMEKLFLKLFHEEEDLSVYLLMDTSLSMGMGNPNKSVYARQIAAALAYIGLMKGDRVSVFTHAAGTDRLIRDQRGRGQVLPVFNVLCELPCTGETNLLQLARRFVLAFKRPGICILISDLLDPAGMEPVIRRLTAARMDTVIIQTLSPQEIEPELTGEWRLMDVESGVPVDISISPGMLEEYRRTVRRFCAGIRDVAVRFGAHYLFSVTDQPFDHLVLRYLRHVGLVQ